MNRRVFLPFLAVLTFLLTLLPASPVSAATFKSSDRVDIGGGEVIRDDIYVFAGTVSVNGTVEGDVIASGGTVVINGTVREDIIVAGGTVFIGGTVGEDVVGAGGTVEVGSEAKVGRDVIIGAGTVSVAGTVGRNLRVGSGTLEISGTVDGNTRFDGDRLEIKDDARIGGNLVYASERNAVISDEATIIGRTTHRRPAEREAPERAGAAAAVSAILFGLVWVFVWTIGTLIVGIVLVLLAPKTVGRVTETITTSPWATLGIGLAILIITPILSLILGFTLIGLPLASIIFGLYLLALYLSILVAGLFFGQSILKLFVKKAEPALMWSLILGFILLTILMVIPFLGALVGLVAVVFGVGAIGLGTARLYRAAPR